MLLNLTDHVRLVLRLSYKCLNITNSPSSLCLVEMASDSTSTTATDASDTATTAASLQHLYLYVGLSNGVMHRASVDATSGAISDIRQRFLGAKPVKLFKISHGQVRNYTYIHIYDTSMHADTVYL
jgi:hypothetical protein